MKNIRINAQNKTINANSIYELKKELNIDKNAITIYRGFATNDDIALNDGDSIIFMKKDEIPSNECLKEMMRARNSPEINAALDSAKIGIAGLGGLGSSVAIALARVGVGYLKLIDFDTIDPSNLNRQQYFISDIGKPKATALADIISTINPFVKVEFENIKLDQDNINAKFDKCNIVAECFDNPQAKAMLINNLKGKIIVAASGMAGYGKSSEIKTIKMAKNLYICGDLITQAQIGNGLMAPRVGICAMHQANQILDILINKEQNNG